MKKIIVVNNGTLPLPAVRGGAVETLIELLIKENEKRNNVLKPNRNAIRNNRFCHILKKH